MFRKKSTIQKTTANKKKSEIKSIKMEKKS